jgi:copper chaperone CopZ
MMEGMTTVDLDVSGMHCASCVERLKAAVSAIPGVEAVDARIGGAHVEYWAEAVSRAQVVEAIEREGYAVTGWDGEDSQPRGFLARMAHHNEKAFGHQRLDCCTLNRPAPERSPEGGY